jgi:carboxymethylenebutenolidase
VTRRQFGVLLGAGVAMTLPRVVNAVAVTDGDVAVTTPDGTADCYFVHPASGAAAGVLLWPDIFGLRPAVSGGRVREPAFRQPRHLSNASYRHDRPRDQPPGGHGPTRSRPHARAGHYTVTRMALGGLCKVLGVIE